MGALDGRVACITGATRGIGRSIAEAFLVEGAKVVVNGLDDERGKIALKEMAAGDAAHFMAGDVTQRDACEALVDATVVRYGRIDILVANAGGGDGHVPVVELSDEAFQAALQSNLWHTFWTMRRALHYMIPQRHGRILTMSCVAGKVAKPGLATYVTAKHAINGLMKTTAQEVGTLGITVNALCPGAMASDPTAGSSADGTARAPFDGYAEDSAIMRPNEADDVAAVAVLLASDAGAGITGSMISIDGGTSPY